MLDPKNSTQISNKGETNIPRPRPIGGDFASLEEKEPELGAILENCLSAIGKLPTPDFQPMKVISAIFGKDTWTAITDLGTQLIGSEAPKNPLKPEEQEKKIEAQKRAAHLRSWFSQGAIQTEPVNLIIQEKRARINSLNGFTEAYQATVDKHGNVQIKYEVDAAAKDADIKKSQEDQIKNSRAQAFARATGKNPNLSNRTDAQEGQSTTANAITSAG